MVVSLFVMKQRDYRIFFEIEILFAESGKRVINKNIVGILKQFKIITDEHSSIRKSFAIRSALGST